MSKQKKLPINVVGLGYIGLPTALMLAEAGHLVVGSDRNQRRIEALRLGVMPLKEEGMKELLDQSLALGIQFESHLISTNLYIVAVATPYRKEDKKIDATQVLEAVMEAVDHCVEESCIVVESTVSPGIMERFLSPRVHARAAALGKKVSLVHAPERIIPGNMVKELRTNARIIGAAEAAAAAEVAKIYRSFCSGTIVETDLMTAELVKVVENTFRDVNIALANEIAKICHKEELDVYEVIRLANMHPRVNLLQPGPGVGGHCISVDPWFLVGDYPELTPLIRTAREVNDSMPRHVLSRILEIMKERNIDSMEKVGIYGLSYKENVEDTRESPALQLAKAMEEAHLSSPRFFDPLVEEGILRNQYSVFNSFREGLALVVLLVGHEHILSSLDDLEGLAVLDTRNIFPKQAFYRL